MAEEIITPWHGDWQARLQSKLESLGFATLQMFLEANPGICYTNLSRCLADANIAPMQIYGKQLREAEAEGHLRAAAVDCLVRCLSQHIKRGWGHGPQFEYRLASGLSDWKCSIAEFVGKGEGLMARLEAVGEAIKACSPPKGWVPSSPADQIIQSAFLAAWPEDNRKGADEKPEHRDKR